MVRPGCVLFEDERPTQTRTLLCQDCLTATDEDPSLFLFIQIFHVWEALSCFEIGKSCFQSQIRIVVHFCDCRLCRGDLDFFLYFLTGICFLTDTTEQRINFLLPYYFSGNFNLILVLGTWEKKSSYLIIFCTFLCNSETTLCRFG